MNSKQVLAVIIVAAMVLSGAPVLAMESDADGSADAPLPEKFDQRERGIVTPVKQQNPLGTCWSFGGTGAAETAILTMLGKTYEETGIDLSERYLAYFANNHIPGDWDHPQAGEGIHFYDEDDVNMPFKAGGKSQTFVQLYSTGSGPVPENFFPYYGDARRTMLDVYIDGELKAERELDIIRSVSGSLYSEIVKEASTIDEAIEKFPQYRDDFFNIAVQKGAIFPEGVDKDNYTADQMRVAVTDCNILRFAKKNCYSLYDDWSIDQKNRWLTVGYTLLDANFLPDTRMIEDWKWKGVNWDAVNAVKSELYMGHGVSGAYDYSASHQTDDGAYYWGGTTMLSNHQIQIIGWDDTFSKDNFSPEHSKPEYDGAWLVKNSWSNEDVGYVVNGIRYYNDFGILDDQGRHTGYFWLSYCDHSISDLVSVSFTDGLSTGNGIFTYCHSYVPDYHRFFDESDDVTRTANVFEADRATDLNAVNITTHQDGARAIVSIYVGVDPDNPTSGVLAAQKEAVYDFTGLHTIMLDEKVKVRQGQRFSIVLEEIGSGGKHLFGYATGFKEDWESQPTPMYMKSVINVGESFAFKNGAWQDWTIGVKEYEEKMPDYCFDNFPMKAYAFPVEGEDRADNIVLGIGVAIGITVVLCIAVYLVMGRRPA